MLVQLILKMKNLEHLKRFKQFNELFNVSKDTMFEGEPLSYWENYEDGEEIVYPTDDDDYLRDEI